MTGPDTTPDATAAPPAVAPEEDVAVAGAFEATLGELATSVDRVVGQDVDGLSDGQVQLLLAAEEQARRRLRADQTRLTAVLTRRRAAAAKAERPDDPRAPEKAARQVRNELSDGLGITPSQAKQVARTGRQLESLPVAAAAHAAGDLTDAHVRVIAQVTAHFVGDAQAAFETELVELAGGCRDAVVFGRRARGLLIERDHDAAMADLQRTKGRRSAAVTQTADGSTLLRLQTAGYPGELVHTAIDAFRTPDAHGERRTAEQRTHDALLAALETALRAGNASKQHGVRPQVAIVIRAESLRDDAGGGVAETRWTGPLPYAEVARLLGDCALTRIVADANDVPLSVSTRVRTIPAGLWQLLEVRDRGCIWPGCDAPPGWCQVAHLDTPYRDDGKLAPDTAGLLCSRHHPRYDNHGYKVRWTDGHPEILDPDGRPVADRQQGRWATRGDPPGHPPGGDAGDPPDSPPLFAAEPPAAYRLDDTAEPSRGPPTRRPVHARSVA